MEKLSALYDVDLKLGVQTMCIQKKNKGTSGRNRSGYNTRIGLVDENGYADFRQIDKVFHGVAK